MRDGDAAQGDDLATSSFAERGVRGAGRGEPFEVDLAFVGEGAATEERAEPGAGEEQATVRRRSDRGDRVDRVEDAARAELRIERPGPPTGHHPGPAAAGRLGRRFAGPFV